MKGYLDNLSSILGPLSFFNKLLYLWIGFFFFLIFFCQMGYWFIPSNLVDGGMLVEVDLQSLGNGDIFLINSQNLSNYYLYSTKIWWQEWWNYSIYGYICFTFLINQLLFLEGGFLPAVFIFIIVFIGIFFIKFLLGFFRIFFTIFKYIYYIFYYFFFSLYEHENFLWGESFFFSRPDPQDSLLNAHFYGYTPVDEIEFTIGMNIEETIGANNLIGVKSELFFNTQSNFVFKYLNYEFYYIFLDYFFSAICRYIYLIFYFMLFYIYRGFFYWVLRLDFIYILTVPFFFFYAFFSKRSFFILWFFYKIRIKAIVGYWYQYLYTSLGGHLLGFFEEDYCEELFWSFNYVKPEISRYADALDDPFEWEISSMYDNFEKLDLLQNKFYPFDILPILIFHY